MTQWHKTLLVAGTCLVLNLATFALIAQRNPEYLQDYRHCRHPDAQHYVLLGRNFILDGNYSRCSSPPYVPDYFRTPVYPLFAGGLDVLGRAGAIYLAHGLLQTLSCVLLYHLVRLYFGERAGFCAAMLLAVDLTLVFANFEAMSEPLFTTLVLASAYCVLPAALPVKGAAPSAARLLVGGFLLALAILTRPAGLYLPVIYAMLLAVGGWRQGALAGGMRCAAIVLFCAYLPVSLWVARNAYVFSVPRLTNNDAVMLVHFTGAGAYMVEHEEYLHQAQKRICDDFGVVPMSVATNPWTSDLSVAEIDADLRRTVAPALSKYPRSLVKSALLGIAKSTLSHNTDFAARFLNDEWNPPGTAALLGGDPEALDRIKTNDPLLLGSFAWQCVLNLAAWALALVGLGRALLNPRWRGFALALLAILAYFHLTVCIVGMSAYWRCRTPHVPYVWAFAGLGAAELLRWLGNRVDGLRGPTPRPSLETSHA